jgi:putative SOS response-associated peptidase YedK
MRDIHDRMPVIIAPEDHAAWLDPGNQATEKLKALLKPCPSERMAAHPVSPRVNTPKIDEPALIDPLESVA